MNNEEKMSYSPEKKKINYYEENPKLFKKQKLRASLENHDIEKDINEYMGGNKINFVDNLRINSDILDMQNNCSVSQPITNNNSNKFDTGNILDDFLNELENEEKNGINSINNDEPLKAELNGLFTKNKYNAYFQTSKTQNPQYTVWNDFHQKRDKL